VPGVSGWLSDSWALCRVVFWRVRREGVGQLLLAFVPFAAILAFVSSVPLITGGGGVKGSAEFATFGLRYGVRSNVVVVGLLLLLAPGLVALFSALGVTRTVQGLIGAEVSRGGLEALLSAPYTPSTIAAAVLGYALGMATAFWLGMSALGAVAVAAVTAASDGHLSLDGGYLALALLLPLLCAWAAAGLTLLVSLLFPRLTQLGATVNVAGGNLGNAVALVPALGGLFALLYGAVDIGVVRLFLITGGVTACIVVISVVGVAWRFRPETVLDS
jgi:hypothetical protein